MSHFVNGPLKTNCRATFLETVIQEKTQASPPLYGAHPGLLRSLYPSHNRLVDSSKDDGILLLRLVCEADKMSMLSAAALLDELMGVDRDRAPNEKKTALHWSDPQVFIAKRVAYLPYISILLT